MQPYLDDYMEIVQTKANHPQQVLSERNNYHPYLIGLLDEVQEVQQEVKDNNTVYLEDELGDILWDYLNVLHYLEQEGKITSRKKVFERSKKKFGERVDDQFNNILRKETKARQKDALQKEHNEKYRTE